MNTKKEPNYAELERKVEELSKQNEAMQETIADWYRTKRDHEKRLLMIPQYFFEKYKDWPKELLILEIQAYMMALRNLHQDRSSSQ